MNRTTIIILAVAVVAVIATASIVFFKRQSGTVGTIQTAPSTANVPSLPNPAASPGNSGFFKQISASHPSLEAQMKILGLTMGQSTFEDAITALGKAKISQTDPGTTETPLEVCYFMQISGNNSSRVILEFLSGSAGGWRILNIARVSEISGNIPSSCIALSSGSALPSAGGISLGMAKKDVQNLLGTPASVEGSVWTYSFDQYSGKGYMNRYVKVFFIGDNVAQFEVSQTNTN